MTVHLSEETRFVLSQARAVLAAHGHQWTDDQLILAGAQLLRVMTFSGYDPPTPQQEADQALFEDDFGTPGGWLESHGVTFAEVSADTPPFTAAIDLNTLKLAVIQLHDQHLSAMAHRVWNAGLDAGDGTSVYDRKGWGALSGIEACRRWGHW